MLGAVDADADCFQPGAALDEAALAAELGLSRTPVHEALVRLAAESLVVLLPNRGATVAGLDWDHIREFLEAFDLEQRVVTRWAALRRTDAQLAGIDAERACFEQHEAAGSTEAMNESNARTHALIAAACGHRLIERSYLQVLALRSRIASLAYSPEFLISRSAYRAHMDLALGEHRAIVAALRAGDADRAEALGRSDAYLARSRIVDVLTRGASGVLDVALAPRTGVGDETGVTLLRPTTTFPVTGGNAGTGRSQVPRRTAWRRHLGSCEV